MIPRWSILDIFTWGFDIKSNTPGDSKWPFHPLVGGHLTIEKGHLTIPKRSQRIARQTFVYSLYFTSEFLKHFSLPFKTTSGGKLNPFFSWYVVYPIISKRVKERKESPVIYRDGTFTFSDLEGQSLREPIPQFFPPFFSLTESGSTTRTLWHGKINPKDWQVASPLVMQGFSNVLRVVSSDYGKLRE